MRRGLRAPWVAKAGLAQLTGFVLGQLLKTGSWLEPRLLSPPARSQCYADATSSRPSAASESIHEAVEGSSAANSRASSSLNRLAAARSRCLATAARTHAHLASAERIGVPPPHHGGGPGASCARGTRCLRSWGVRHRPRPLDRHGRGHLPDGVASNCLLSQQLSRDRL